MIAIKLFTINCIHQYFNYGQCSDLQIEPTASCSILMKRFLLHYKQEEASTYSVYFIQPDSAVKIPLPTAALSFYIFISNDAFFKYTQNPLVKTTPPNNNDGADNNNIFLFSGTTPATGAASFNVERTPKPSPFLFQNRKLFGVISIIPPPEVCIYTLTLQAVAVKWRYYIVADKSIGDVLVKESNLSEDTTGKITFKNLPADATDMVYSSVKTSFPDAGVFVNESESEISLVQKQSKKLQLWNATDKNNESILMDNLPLPSVQDSGQKVIYLQNTS